MRNIDVYFVKKICRSLCKRMLYNKRLVWRVSYKQEKWRKI